MTKVNYFEHRMRRNLLKMANTGPFFCLKTAGNTIESIITVFALKLTGNPRSAFYRFKAPRCKVIGLSQSRDEAIGHATYRTVPFIPEKTKFISSC